MAVCSVTDVRSEELLARDYFRMLPTTIFDTTLEGMSEEEQRELLDNGETVFWEVRNEGHDGLDMVSRPLGDTVVALRVFRGGRQGTLAVLGTVGAPLCTLELWRADSNGRIVPVDTPDEPGVREFFGPDHALPQGVEPAVFFCVTDAGLEARSVFWTSTGMVQLPVDFRLHYVWRDGQFRKTVLPANASPEAPSGAPDTAKASDGAGR